MAHLGGGLSLVERVPRVGTVGVGGKVGPYPELLIWEAEPRGRAPAFGAPRLECCRQVNAPAAAPPPDR